MKYRWETPGGVLVACLCVALALAGCSDDTPSNPGTGTVTDGGGNEDSSAGDGGGQEDTEPPEDTGPDGQPPQDTGPDAGEVVEDAPVGDEGDDVPVEDVPLEDLPSELPEGDGSVGDAVDADGGGPCAVDGTACDDEDPCTEGDVCLAGECVGTPIECEDGEPCTEDSCDPESGECVFDPEPLEGQSCDDGDLCTDADLCLAGACVGQGVVCSDEDPCTQDACDEDTGECVYDTAGANGTPCDDGEVCTVDDACDGGVCAGALNACDDQNPCTIDSCDPASGACVNDPGPLEGQGCFDGNLCTLATVCEGGDCVGDTVVCDDGDDCTADSCDPATGQCLFDATINLGEPCDDGSVCTEGDACADLGCVGDPVDCVDDNECTEDSCDPQAGCIYPVLSLNGEPCADGACTGSCFLGVCQATDVDCEDGDPCTTSACEPATGDCAPPAPADGAPCDDGDLCTVNDLCLGGSCAGQALDCNDGNGCTADSCDAATGACINDGAALDGTTCDDGNLCTDGDTCVGGACGAELACPPGEACNPVTGACLVSDGDTCAAPFFVGSLPFVDSGTTEGASDEYGYAAGACPPEEGGWGANAPDLVYQFVPPADAIYNITLEAAHDANLYVVTDCGDVNGSCVAGWELVGLNLVEEVNPFLLAGEVYFIIVDGYGASQQGLYTLTVSPPCTPSCEGAECGSDGCGGSCGVCEPGLACNAGVCIDNPETCAPVDIIGCGASLQGLTFSENTSDALDSYSCGEPFIDFTGPELVYAFVSDAPAFVTVDAFGPPGLVTQVLEDSQVEGCDAAAASCLTSQEGFAEFSALPGVVYYLTWEQAFPDENFPFDVFVNCCVPDCGGKQCGFDGCGGTCGECAFGDVCNPDGQCQEVGNTCSPIAEVDCGAFIEGDFTSPGATNSMGAYACGEQFPDLPFLPEETWSFTPAEDTTVILEPLEIPPGVSYYVLEDQGNGCEATADNCVAAAFFDDVFEAQAGQTYYIVVDQGFQDFPGGGFPYGFALNCCEPSCENPDGTTKSCGGDGCGGSCGQCGPGEVCSPEGACGALPDACQPIAEVQCGSDGFGVLPADASNALGDYAPCEGGTEPFWGESPELVWTFTPEVDSFVFLEIFEPGPTIPFILEDQGGGCEASTQSCIGGGFSGQEFQAQAGVTYYIVFDAEIPDFGPGEEYPVGFFLQCCESSCTNPDGSTKECGFDGCGGTCGECGAGDVCTPEGQCLALPTECAPVETIGCNVGLNLLSLTQEGAVAAFDDYASNGCPDNPFLPPDQPFPSSELVYEYVAEATESVSVSATGPVVVTVLEGACDGAAACLAQEFGQVSFDAVEGTTYYIVLDSDIAGGGFELIDLTVACCTPSCDGTTCGGDGCGGVCECASGVCADIGGICGELCDPEVPDSCPAGQWCQPQINAQGICAPVDAGGAEDEPCGGLVLDCCSAEAGCVDPDVRACACGFDAACCEDGVWPVECAITANNFCGLNCDLSADDLCQEGLYCINNACTDFCAPNGNFPYGCDDPSDLCVPLNGPSGEPSQIGGCFEGCSFPEQTCPDNGNCVPGELSGGQQDACFPVSGVDWWPLGLGEPCEDFTQIGNYCAPGLVCWQNFGFPEPTCNALCAAVNGPIGGPHPDCQPNEFCQEVGLVSTGVCTGQ